jgi:hypothetical protein
VACSLDGDGSICDDASINVHSFKSEVLFFFRSNGGFFTVVVGIALTLGHDCHRIIVFVFISSI